MNQLPFDVEALSSTSVITCYLDTFTGNQVTYIRDDLQTCVVVCEPGTGISTRFQYQLESDGAGYEMIATSTIDGLTVQHRPTGFERLNKPTRLGLLSVWDRLIAADRFAEGQLHEVQDDLASLANHISSTKRAIADRQHELRQLERLFTSKLEVRE